MTTSICRPCLSALLGAGIALARAMPALGQQQCKPVLAIKDVRFPEIKLPSLERRWTALVTVDAARCAPNSAGYFGIGFSRAKENAPDIDFSEQFVWMPPAVQVGVDFWMDEAAEAYWINNVSACACAR